jgi:Spy/CpxP family protein refolding chaperone
MACCLLLACLRRVDRRCWRWRQAARRKPGAQAAPAPQNGPSRPELNLTDDQKAQMKKIHQDAKAQIEAVNNDSSLSADQKQAKIHAIRRGSHKQVEAMLTPEQRKTMRAWHHAHRGEKSQEQAPPAA